jgi:DNA polymerase
MSQINKIEKLKIIQDKASSCQNCNLFSTRNKCVFAKGSEHSKIMFVCEAPGKQEDIEGIPLVGKSGKNLDKLLSSLNIDENIYFCNAIKCRPPDNRKPSYSEIESCKEYLFRIK